MHIPKNLDDKSKFSLRKEYVSRINRVIDYIDNNFSSDLTLEKLSGIANFSPYHFHRLFKSFVGETLFQYIQRVRLERAAYILCNNSGITITEIAFDCGYSDSSSFAKAFGNYFGMSASEFRLSGGDSKNSKTVGKDGKLLSKTGKDFEISSYYISAVFDEKFQNYYWRISMNETNQLEAKVEVRDCPEMTVAYIRNIGPYKGDNYLFETLIGKLMLWAGPRGLIRYPETKMLTIYHDNHEITEAEKLRISVCITVPPDTKVDGEIGKLTIPGGKYAIAHFEIDQEQYGDAWNSVYAGWMPESGYQPDDRPCFEMYMKDPKTHPQGKHIVDIYAPVKPL